MAVVGTIATAVGGATTTGNRQGSISIVCKVRPDDGPTSGQPEDRQVTVVDAAAVVDHRWAALAASPIRRSAGGERAPMMITGGAFVGRSFATRLSSTWGTKVRRGYLASPDRLAQWS